MSKKQQEKEKKEIALKGRIARQLILSPWKEDAPERMTRDEWLAAIAGDIDPLKHAGEGWFSTEEYARPADISDPIVRYQVGKEEDYYPETQRKRRRR